MLPRANRLRRQADFRRVYARSKTLITPGFVWRYQHSQGSRQARIGIVVGLKVSKKATVRNRLRRRIREVFRFLLPDIPRQHILIIIARPRSDRLTYRQVLEECASGIRRILRPQRTGSHP